MKKTLYIILLTVLFNLQACDDYVDIEPRGSAIASTLEDINFLLDDATGLSSLLGNDIPSFLNDNKKVEDDVLILASSSLETSNASNIYNLEPLFHIANQTDVAWASHYKTIGTINYILEVLNDIDRDNPLKNQYTAEAKVHRAYHYFKLVNIYSVHYGLPEASQTGSGVPILTIFSDDTVSLVRASVNEVYDFILNDLNEALPFLSENVISNDRASKASGLGLLAEVEMHRGNYEIASGLIDDALAFNNNLNDYNTDLVASLPPSGINNPESLFFKTTQVISQFDFDNPAAGIRIFSTYSNELLAITDTDFDLRFTSFTQENEFGNFALNRNYIFEIGVTIPRLMLFKAECLARNNDFTTAMNFVNQLRAKRFDATLVSFGGHILTASSSEEALEHIMEETRREFHVSGLRFFDIKRLNAIENAGISISRNNGNTFTANSINWAAPISQSVIETSNGQISQNPRE